MQCNSNHPRLSLFCFPSILNNIFTVFILLYSLVVYSSSQFNPAFCTNYYSPTNPPSQCSPSGQCYFYAGLQELVSNKTSDVLFVLCLDLPNYSIYVDLTNASANYVQAIQSVYIYASAVSISNNYSLLCERNLVIISQQLISIEQSSLTGAKMFIISNQNIYINGSTFINESVVQSECSCSVDKRLCNWTFAYPKLFDYSDNFNISNYFPVNATSHNFTFTPNNSATFIARQYLQINASYLKYSIIGIFSQTVNIYASTVLTSGLGYPSDSGPGCGYFDQVLNQLLGCMGSGGSHGGFGGNSSPQNCYLLVSRQPYDSIYFPIEPGSGGGFFLPHSKQSSAGGGVINIQASTIMMTLSSIASQGKNGIQGGGGGAGGTISLDYNVITGINTIISTNGGNGDKMSSSGAGGRVRLWNHKWKVENESNVNITITVTGGAGCKISQLNASIQLSCGENGSVYTSPCRPGTALDNQSYICQPCPQGYYQMSYGYSRCIPCTAKPDNSTWNSTQVEVNSSFIYENSCSFTCDDGFYMYKGKCLTNSQLFMEKIYATNIFISLGMIGSAIAIYMLVMLFKRLALQERILSFDDPTLNEAYRKKFFRLEDLPYHEIRLYLSGQNHPFNPWKITQQAEQNLYTEIRHPVNKINHIIARVIKEINKKAEYSRWQKILVTGLRYSYYPLSRIVLSSMRKKKAMQIFDQVDKYNKKIPEDDLLGIKFHVKPQQTVASLEIFNYSKSVLDFYIENYFPLYIQLEKAPFGGYIIDYSDPFLKVFINEVVQKQMAGKSLQGFLHEVNALLKNPAKMTSCLNHLWNLSDINSKFEAFLWQPTIKILGIDRQYKADKKQPLFLIFSSQNLNNNHFLQNRSLPYEYLPQIECLKHKFIIRKDLANQEDGSSIYMINNQFNQKSLIWWLGILTTAFLLLAFATLFLNAFVIGKYNKCNNDNDDFSYGFVIYFALWPLCDFSAAFLNFKTILSKCEYVLADSISFNIFTVIKSMILFICLLVKFPNFGKGCLEANEFIWLSMFVIGIAIFLVQIMLRSKIIQRNV